MDVTPLCLCSQLQVTIAELYEKDGAFEDSAEAYQSASDYFVSVGMYPQAVRCLLTSAAYLADQDAYVSRGPAVSVSVRVCDEVTGTLVCFVCDFAAFPGSNWPRKSLTTPSHTAWTTTC